MNPQDPTIRSVPNVPERLRLGIPARALVPLALALCSVHVPAQEQPRQGASSQQSLPQDSSAAIEPGLGIPSEQVAMPPRPSMRIAVTDSDSMRFQLPRLAEEDGDSPPPLSLDSAVAIVVRGNHEIQLAHARWRAAREAAWSAWGVFEPKLVGRYNRQETDIQGPLLEVKEDYRIGIQGILPTATQYDFGMRHSNYFHSATTSEMFAGASLRQPLLKGIWFFAPFATMRLAKAEERKAYHEYRSQLAAAIAKLHASFWECVYAAQLLYSENESVRIARDLQRDGIQRITSGKISPLELEKISSELASRISRSLDARRQLQDARNQLTTQLSSPEKPWLGSVRLQLPPDLRMEPPPIPEAAALDSFTVWNADFLAQESEIARMRISVAARRDARLPSVDLIGSFGYVGTGKNGTIARTDFEDSPHPQISAGIEIEMPLAGNIKETHQVRVELLGLKAAGTRLSQIELKCRKDQDDLLRQIQQFLEQSREERRTVTYHQRELEAEFRKLAAGKSNYPLLYEIEEKLRDSQKRMLESIRAFQLARIELSRTRGVLLRDNGLEWLDGGEPLLKKGFLQKR